MTGSGDGWVRAHAVDDVPVAGAKMFRHLDKRIALFRTPQGLFATDNRCPHQGYALVQGDVKEGVLTCAWHNWKFTLASGACTFGGENVRTYPVEIRGDQVWLDLTDPAAEEITPQLFASLLEAMGELDVGRMARDAMRLQRVGVPLSEVIREGVRYGAPRGKYGWNHSLATLADCMNLATFLDGPLKSLSVLQGLSVVSENEVRRPFRPRPEPINPVAAYGSIEVALRMYPRLVDDERGEDAEALLRGLIAAGAAPARIRHALLVAVTDHFLSYGHAMIYCMKAFELLDEIGWHEADTVLGPLALHQTLSTRYDKIPYMARFLREWKAADLDLVGLLGNRQTGAFDEASYRRDLVDGSPEDAFRALRNALEAGVPVVRIIDATSRAASERFSRFDIDIDTDDTNEWGWLDVTHTLTYINALRWAWSVDPSPEVLRGLFHAVWFVQWTQQLDRRGVPESPQAFRTSEADALPDAVRRRDPEAAVAIARGYDGPVDELDRALARIASEDEHTAPIMVAHSVKTSRAAIMEAKAIGNGEREPIAAAVRFLASPKRERFVFNATLEAVAFVQGRARGDSE
jgi:nitrite reductase/ring-hydroxylating ferredoxin subunit